MFSYDFVFLFKILFFTQISFYFVQQQFFTLFYTAAFFFFFGDVCEFLHEHSRTKEAGSSVFFYYLKHFSFLSFFSFFLHFERDNFLQLLCFSLFLSLLLFRLYFYYYFFFSFFLFCFSILFLLFRHHLESLFHSSSFRYSGTFKCFSFFLVLNSRAVILRSGIVDVGL